MEAANSTTESNRSLAAGLVQRLEGLTKAPPSQPNERPLNTEIPLKLAFASYRYDLQLAYLSIRQEFLNAAGYPVLHKYSKPTSHLRSRI